MKLFKRRLSRLDLKGFAVLGLMVAQVAHGVPNVPTTTGYSPPTVGGGPPPSTNGWPASVTGINPFETGIAATPPPPAPTPAGPPLNPALKNCIDGTLWAMQNPTQPAPAKCDEIQRELKMVPAQGAPPLTGLFNIKGERCPDGTVPSVSNQCVFEVKAWWKAVCIPPITAGKCTKARELWIDYSVQQVGPTIPGLAPSSPVKSGFGAQRPTAILSMASIALGQSTSAQITCAQLYPNDPSKSIQTGVDANGAPICGNPMQAQICQLETANVLANGGSTTQCMPNITVIKLLNKLHDSAQCTAVPGASLVRVSNGQTVINPVVADNTTLFCRFNGSACPVGWNQFQNWRTTQNVQCQQQRVYHHCPLIDPGYYNTSANSCIVGPFGYCSLDTKNSGSNAWSNVPRPFVKVPIRLKSCATACTCTDVDSAGNYSAYNCEAAITQVGCY